MIDFALFRGHAAAGGPHSVSEGESRLLTPTPTPKPIPTPTPTPARAPLRWSVADLLKGGRIALIEHDGAEYRLQLTRQNKLLLTK